MACGAAAGRVETRGLEAAVCAFALVPSSPNRPPVPVTAPASSPAAPADASLSAAEQTRAARIGAVLFRNRGWLPVPFIGVPLLVPGTQRAWTWVVAALLVVIGEAFRLTGVAAAGTVTRRRSRAVQRLVTYGIFAWVRNPLYVGNLFAWLGVVVASGVLWFLPVAVVLFAVEYTFIVRFEEGVLESTFGEEYLAYKRRTPRWVPRQPGADAARSGPHYWGEAWRSELSTLLQYVVIGLALVAKNYIARRYF